MSTQEGTLPHSRPLRWADRQWRTVLGQQRSGHAVDVGQAVPGGGWLQASGRAPPGGRLPHLAAQLHGRSCGGKARLQALQRPVHALHVARLQRGGGTGLTPQGGGNIVCRPRGSSRRGILTGGMESIVKAPLALRKEASSEAEKSHETLQDCFGIYKHSYGVPSHSSFDKDSLDGRKLQCSI